MVRLCRGILLLGILFAAGPRVFAASAAETRDFNAAASAFRLGFYDRAEAGFANFATNYLNSPRLPEAFLYQAQARLQQSNYAGAISLLTDYKATAGTNADQYVFWMAEANYRASNFMAAATVFAGYLHDFPNSSRRLEAAIGEASARARLSDWPSVIKLLGETNGFFQAAAHANATNDLVLRGAMLLSEASFALSNYPAAEAAVLSMGPVTLPPDTDWQRQYLISRIQLATGRTNEALQSAGRLLTLATNTTRRDLLPESAAYQAGLLEQMGRTDEAAAAYQLNLADGVPAQRQRQALWKVTELFLARNKTGEAARVLQKFVAQYPDSPSADLALLTLSEVRLRQYLTAQSTNAQSAAPVNGAAETNYLGLALESLQDFVKRFPNSPLLGNAQLNRGWSFWFQTNLPEAQVAFQAAAQLLPSSTNQATAYFKLADTQFRQKDYAGAITNYDAVIEKFSAMPEVADKLIEPALYQIVQAGIESQNLAAATNALAKILTSYPDGFHAGRAVLLTGQEFSRLGEPLAARKLFQAYAGTETNSTLLPQVHLAIARTYEQQDDWTNAIHEYDRSLASLTNGSARAQVEYYRAQATYKAGDLTNALTQFTNFFAVYPASDLAPRALMWVADYYFNAGLWMQAEASYKMLYRNTNNWPVSDLTYQAQMMAGRAALERGAGDAAKGYFTVLYNNTNGPLDLRIQALYAYGDCFMSQDSTNRAIDYQEASKIFGKIYELYPTNPLAAVAWGGRATALLQWAKLSDQPMSTYGDVSNAFRQVIDSTNAPISARAQAKLGLAITLEKMAEPATATNRVALLTLALNQCLDVFDGSVLRDGEKPDPGWRRDAGIKAAQLAETLQKVPQAIHIYEELCDLVPSARMRFEKSILRLKALLLQTP